MILILHDNKKIYLFANAVQVLLVSGHRVFFIQ